jgi:hypothetical protein
MRQPTLSRLVATNADNVVCVGGEFVNASFESCLCGGGQDADSLVGGLGEELI